MNEKALFDFTSLILTQWTLLTSVGIFLFLRLLGAIKWLNARNTYRRLLPVIPELLGIGAVFAGAVPAFAEAPIIHKVFCGLVCAYLSKFAQKFLGQMVIGDDNRIKFKTSPAQIAAEELGPDAGEDSSHGQI